MRYRPPLESLWNFLAGQSVEAWSATKRAARVVLYPAGLILVFVIGIAACTLYPFLLLRAVYRWLRYKEALEVNLP